MPRPCMTPRPFMATSTAVLFAAAAMLAGTGGAAADDEAEIRDIWQKYSAARVAGDADAWLALWDADAIKLSEGSPARSRAELDAGVPKSFAATPTSAMNIHADEIVVTGDWAYSRGTYDADRTVGGEATHIDGKFLTILKRQDDGSWKIYRDMSNSNS